MLYSCIAGVLRLPPILCFNILVLCSVGRLASATHGVTAFPTFQFYVDGKVVATVTGGGVVAQQQLAQQLDIQVAVQ